MSRSNSRTEGSENVARQPEKISPHGSQPAGRARIGCVSWCFHSFAAGADPEEALDIIGELGFEGTDLILLARQDIHDFWTETRMSPIRNQLQRNQLELAQVVSFQPAVEGLTS